MAPWTVSTPYIYIITSQIDHGKHSDVTKSTAPPSVTATATEAAAVFVADSK